MAFHAEYAPTPAHRLLTVENSKTTLRRLAVENSDTSTLLAACAFPTKALLSLPQTLDNARTLAAFLTSATGERRRVAGMLVVPGWWVERNQGASAIVDSLPRHPIILAGSLRPPFFRLARVTVFSPLLLFRAPDHFRIG